MGDAIILENGDAVDADTGEFLMVANMDDALKFTAQRRHQAKAEEDAWKAYRAVLDQILIRYQLERRTVYDGLDVSVKGGKYTSFDRESWQADIAEIELTRAELFHIVLAATGFDRDDLPEAAREAFDIATKQHEKRPWVESRVTRTPAPRMKRQPAGELEGWAETLEMVTGAKV